MFTAIDHAHMARALRLAERGLYTTQPNPRVGCVIAHGADLVGEGWHQRAGEAHAELHALRAAGERARGATAYVTLEPCAHHGRTGPCADALLAAGVTRVVAAHEDPFPEVAGRGLARLRAAGVEVAVGLQREAARELNRGFLSRIERGRPWLRVKSAISLDGRTALATGASQWISGAAARVDVARWRARSSAVMTAIGTVLADDPRLTVRLPDDQPFVAPLRVVLDRQLRTPAQAHVVDGSAPTLIYCAPSAESKQANEFARASATIVRDAELMSLAAILTDLARRGCNEVQVEAGATLAGALLEAGLVDELLLYVAPCILGDRGRPLFALPELRCMEERAGFVTIEQRQLGGDLRLLLRPSA